MLIYQATRVDAPVMADIHAMAFSGNEAWDTHMIATQLSLPGYFGLLHRHGGMLLARVTADEAEILTIAVAPEIRRSGAGARLLREALDRAKDMGATAMFLEVSVANSAARGLYGRFGFAEVGRRRRYYPDGTDALVLRLGLNANANPS